MKKNKVKEVKVRISHKMKGNKENNQNQPTDDRKNKQASKTKNKKDKGKIKINHKMNNQKASTKQVRLWAN